MRTIQRVLHQTTDISQVVNDFRDGSYAFAYTAGQYLYVGGEVPFNQLWVEPLTFNSVASVLSVSTWWARSWVPVVDLVDGTSPAGKGLARAGRVQWALDRVKGWDVEEDSADVTGLSGTAIYWMYWLRMSWSATLSSSTKLAYVGQRFSSDLDLFGSYPDLNNADLMTSFAAGKTDWGEQAYMAAEAIARTLIGRKIILSRGQIFDDARLVEPSVHKTAELVYRGMGKAFEANRLAAAQDYAKAMNQDFFRVDRNGDGRLDAGDKRHSTSFLTR